MSTDFDRYILTMHCPKSDQNFRDITRNVGENMIYLEIVRVVQYLVFPVTFPVISRKIDYIWDSLRCCGGLSAKFKNRSENRNLAHLKYCI